MLTNKLGNINNHSIALCKHSLINWETYTHTHIEIRCTLTWLEGKAEVLRVSCATSSDFLLGALSINAA